MSAISGKTLFFNDFICSDFLIKESLLIKHDIPVLNRIVQSFHLELLDWFLIILASQLLLLYTHVTDAINLWLNILVVCFVLFQIFWESSSD